jgi:hypothetical protein
MKLLNIVLLSLIVFYSCQNKQAAAAITNSADTTSITFPAQETANIPDIDTDDATRWLTEVIESHLNDGGYPMEDICTPTYAEYKNDAMQIGYDGGMTEADFKKKWNGKYDTKHAGQGTAFLISGQDNGKVRVTKCVAKGGNTAGFLVLSVTIDDLDFKVSYHRDIKIVAVGKAYLIADVVEFD